MNNEPGSMEDYPDWMMRPEICPDTGYFLCRICGTLRGTAGSFNAHRIRKHGHIRHKMKCPIGYDTCAKQVNMEKLRQHLLKDHDFESVLEKRSFACKDDFLKWKGEIELSTNAHFIRKFFVRGANDYYSCNRSGDCESQVRRYAKKRGKEKEEESLATANSPVKLLRGTGKMGAHCPATITVHYDDAGKAFVEAYLTHVGHELDVRHLPLPKGLRERVRNLLRLGKDTNEVLRILESEAVPGDRTSMVTGRLVKGIRRLDQEGMNAGHLDANYLLVQPELVVERKPSEEWLVQSSKDHRQFSVTKSEFGCPNEECHIRCHHCKICPHMYSCSCVRPPQSAHLPCMHIHGVHFLRERHALHTHVPAENFDIPFKRSRTNISPVKAREQYTAVHSPLENSTAVHSPLEHSTAVHSPDNQEITVSDTNDGCVVDEIASPTNDDSSDNEHGESNQATMMASQKMVEEEVAVAGPSLDSTTERVAANEGPAVPNKKTVAALRELNALEKRLVLKIEEWKTMWTALPLDALLEARKSGNRLEGMLNDLLWTARRALPKALQITPAVPTLSTAQAVLLAPTPTQKTHPIAPGNLPISRKRNLLTSDNFRERARQDTEWMRARNAAIKNKAISHQQATTSTSSALERAIFDHKSLSAKVDDTSKGASSPSHITTVASTSATASARPTGKVIVLQYSKKPSNTLATTVSPQIVASNLRFRPIIRCVACKQVIGSNHLLAKKCVKCDQWCHHICSHSCAV